MCEYTAHSVVYLTTNSFDMLFIFFAQNNLPPTAMLFLINAAKYVLMLEVYSLIYPQITVLRVIYFTFSDG